MVIEQDPLLFTKLSNLHNPTYFWIGCADARVPSNTITGTPPGEIFVHRNIANMVIHTDINLLSCLQYAIDVLSVKHIVVCGHYGCGGVQASMTNQHYGMVDNWLRHVKDVYRLYQTELNNISDIHERCDRLVELNVIEQVNNLSRTFTIVNHWKKGKPLTIHGWVYSLKDGLLKDLKVSLSGAEQVIPIIPDGLVFDGH
eukprot:TRINITY_DN6493_c0_g1_i2.p1 TRINITY_DN6493_c0_g1~~TRINITY_DN6493_c0_g1_i2.p1  ORF type:complete len:200 (+),score=13.81 TRINITY_DN6493_c0_g1_i2:142-741(+)